MSLSAGKRDAMEEITSLAGSSKPTSEIVEGMLEAARRAVGAACLSLVAADTENGGTRSWSASADGAGDLVERCAAAAAAACVHDGHSDQQDGIFVKRIQPRDGLFAALAGIDVAPSGLFEVLSAYLALVLANDKLSEELEAARKQSAKRLTEVSAVYEIGQAISDLDIDRLLPLITEKAAAVMGAQACSLVLRDADSDHLTIRASWGLADDIVHGARIKFGEGIDGTVAQTGEAMLLADVGADPRLASGAVSPRKEISSSICAPLKDEAEHVMGVLNIRRHVPAPPFTEDDLKLFCVFASQAGLAISNASLYTNLCMRVAEMYTISDLLKTINSTLDVNSVLDQIADNIIKVVGFERCCVYLFDPRTREFVAGIRRGFAEGELPERVTAGEGVIGLAAEERIPIFERDDSGREKAILAAPIVVRQECIGVVVVDNIVTGRPIQPQTVDLLSAFVSQAGIAIENARLYEAMESKYAELNVLFEHSKTISSAYGLENAAQISIDVARKAVPCDGCALVLLRDKRATVSVNAASGIPEDLLDAMRELMARKESESAEAIRQLRSPKVITSESAKEPALFISRLRHPSTGSGCSPKQRLMNNAGKYSEAARDLLRGLIGADGSVLLVPLLAEDATIGAFALFRRTASEFTTAETKLLAIVASQAAVVLKNAIRYEQRAGQQVLDLSTLYEFSRRISSSSSLEEALDAILGIVTGLVDCDGAAIYAIDHERQAMVATAARSGSGPAEKPPEESLAGSSVMAWTVRERKAVVSPDIGSDPRFVPASFSSGQARSLMSIPLMVQDEAVGVLCVYSASPNLYSEDDLRVLSIIASQSAAIYKELEALAALTSYTDNVLSSIAAGVVTLDIDGIVLTWNHAAESITGLSASQVTGLNYKHVVKSLSTAEADKSTTIEIVENVRSTGKLYQGYKLCYHLPDGDVAYLNLSASVLSNNAGEPLGVVIIFEDITKDIKMEDEFRRMGELAAVGQLAATIAHELRNPLSSIKGAAQFLQKEYEDHPSIVEFLDIIIEEVNGLSKLTTEFLEFARPMELDLQPVNINEVVRKTLQFMSPNIGESGVVVKEDLAADLPVIEADEKQIEQVLRNLILNGLQAMPEGGILTVRTRPLPGRAVEMCVVDTGVGIPESQVCRIFVPFFTTKTKGTGLGLPVVQKTVENHGGHVEVSSIVGEGTVFKVTLPVERPVTSAPPEADTTERRL
ncbi:MAG: GAF domain-containing protein [Armatimonadetes bacterium]|nr:GAF domain-containing protein [Armatimonadota bacterium]